MSETLDGETLGLEALAVVAIEGGDVRIATFGRELDGAPVGPSTGFEIGSVTKALTGLLLADLIDAGRVEADTTLAEATRGTLELEGEGARTELARLARHRAGWPRLPVAMLPRAILLPLGARNPYAGGPEEVLRAGAAQDASRGDQAYSNLGFAALGNALAARERTDYGSLLRRRVLDPLEMHDTHVLGTDDPLPDRRVRGRDSAGRIVEPWRASGWQPAGVGVWSTAADLSRLAAAVLAGTAPGIGATEPPLEDGGRNRLGYGWWVSDVGDREVLWHNGGTGGFRAWFGLSRADGRGVAVMSNTTRDVDALGLHLLTTDPVPDGRGPSSSMLAPLRWMDIAFALLIAYGTAVALLRSVRHLRHGRADRQSLVRGVASAVSTLALARVIVAWERVPVWLWSLGAGLTLASLILASLARSTTPVSGGARPMRRRLVTALAVAWSASLVALTL